MIKILKRFINLFWIDGYPIKSIIVFIVSIGLSLMLSSIILAAIIPSEGSEYEKLFNQKMPDYLLSHKTSNELFLIDTKRNKEIGLDLNADLVVNNEEYNSFYLIDFLEDRLKIKEIKKYKDKIINSDEFEIKITLNKDEISDFKFSNGHLYLINFIKKQLVKLNLREQSEIHYLELPSDLIDWDVYGDKVYLATTSEVYYQDAKNELKELLVGNNIKDISINHGMLSVLEGDEGFYFLATYNLNEFKWINSIAFDASEVDLLDSSSSEMHLYVSKLNNKGGIVVEMMDLKTADSYSVNLNLNNVKSNLKFIKGFGYYIEKNNNINVYQPSGDILEVETKHSVKNIYQFY